MPTFAFLTATSIYIIMWFARLLLTDETVRSQRFANGQRKLHPATTADGYFGESGKILSHIVDDGMVPRRVRSVEEP